MLEVVTVGAISGFLTAVLNGAAGEAGKQLLVSTGVQLRRTLGRPVPLPATDDGVRALADDVHTLLRQDQGRNGEWSILMNAMAAERPELRRGAGLPPAPWEFTDRTGVLRQLGREASRSFGGRPRMALLYGPPGIGTSAVALHWGADQAGRYPDGQFHIDLRDGSGEHGPGPGAVLRRVLRQMGVPDDRLPPTEAGCVRFYRELTAERRVLVVVDHVTSAAQVRYLKPAAPEVFLLMVASGAELALDGLRLAVPPLKDRDAVKLLRRVSGDEAVARAKPELPGLLDGCGGNAFALKAAALRLAEGATSEGGAPSVDGSLSVDGAGGDPVRRSVRAACSGLGAQAARMCRLTALTGLPGLDAGIAARAAELTVAEARGMLEAAVEAQLAEALPDGRYRYRPSVARQLAADAAAEHGVAECAAAVSRTLAEVLDRALGAAHAALPQSWRTEHGPETGNRWHTEDEGLAALLAEAPNVCRAVTVADEYQHTGTALRLARALWPVQLKTGYRAEALPALRLATDRADTHHPQAAAGLHFQLAHCLGELGQYTEADREARRAVDCERSAAHHRGEASAVELRGLLCLRRWQYDQAYEHFTTAEEIYGRIGDGDEGTADLPRALALTLRHRGRALRGMQRPVESRELLEEARRRLAALPDPYNEARALTDLAETLLDSGEFRAALARITEAESLLSEAATPHRDYLARLRERCRGTE
ncbi:tetratricopeptide repeat protein [Streptomyces sp. NPDC058045]|uniref:tetratricopeptide repeat protein n=1 Tax=Streptomyces sp. NPDC058045 TaxID=3346311 RepID=UPI0036EFA8F7